MSQTPAASNRGKGAFRLVFLLIVLGGIAAFFYPVLLARFPLELAGFERLRGAYSGPALTPLPGDRTGFSPEVQEIEQPLPRGDLDLYFVPAATHSYYLSAYTQYFADVRLDLFDPESGEVLDSNTRYPPFTGRQADMWADTGDEAELSHAIGFPADLVADRLYGIRIIPESDESIGTTLTASVRIEDTAIAVGTIWGIFSGALFVLTIAALILTSKRHRA